VPNSFVVIIVIELKKDPGIPNLLPWKSDLLDAAEQRKQEEALAKGQPKLSAQEQLEEMRRLAEEQADEFEENDESSEEGYVGPFKVVFPLQLVKPHPFSCF